jgi:hypothetical protein
MCLQVYKREQRTSSTLEHFCHGLAPRSSTACVGFPKKRDVRCDRSCLRTADGQVLQEAWAKVLQCEPKCIIGVLNTPCYHERLQTTPVVGRLLSTTCPGDNPAPPIRRLIRE